MRPPTVIRFEDSPQRLRLLRGRSEVHETSIVVASDRDANIAVSVRLPDESFTFENGETEITQIESFTTGEQREVVLEWAVRNDADVVAPLLYVEVHVRYEDREDESNMATLALPIEHGLGIARMALLGAVTAAAVGAALVTAARRAVRAVEEDDITIGIVEVETPRRPSRAKRPAKKPAGGTRRGSAASRSAPRKDARGSSAARKSSARRPTRKSP